MNKERIMDIVKNSKKKVEVILKKDIMLDDEYNNKKYTIVLKGTKGILEALIDNNYIVVSFDGLGKAALSLNDFDFIYPEE